MAGRQRRHWNCPNKATTSGAKRAGYAGRIINAYVRLGSPPKWTVIGEVCIDCGDLTYCGEPPDAELERARIRLRTTARSR